MNKVKVLIVDDYKENIEALSSLITDERIDILSATNADTALELVAKNDFGLLLLDVQMPVTNGFELAKIIRSVDKFKSLPIIFVTAHQPDINFIFEGYQTGAVDLLFKPLNAAIVRSKVHLFVEMAMQRELLRTQIESLALLKHQAEIASAAKTAFLANMSHEIRTPLSAIMGFADLCLQADADIEEIKSYVQVVHRNSGQVLKLVDDLLDITKVEAGKIDIEKIAFGLEDLLLDLQDTFFYKTAEKGIKFGIKILNPLPRQIISDPTRLRQVLVNGIGNALKFTDKGSVELAISFVNGELTIDILDTGTGISEDQVGRLFQAFNQADQSTTRKYGGTGLGLYLNREICKLLGGNYTLKESKFGTGSTFRATFKVQAVQADDTFAHLNTKQNFNSQLTEKGNDTAKLEGLKVLVVDDSEDNRHLLHLLLGEQGATVDSCDNGAEAIKKAALQPYDAVLMDIQMPMMDGYEALRLLRANQYAGQVYALTAHAMTSEVDRVYSAGFDGYFSKPLDIQSLIEKLMRAAAAQAEAGSSKLG